jgi:hypothetical protein
MSWCQWVRQYTCLTHAPRSDSTCCLFRSWDTMNYQWALDVTWCHDGIIDEKGNTDSNMLDLHYYNVWLCYATVQQWQSNSALVWIQAPRAFIRLDICARFINRSINPIITRTISHNQSVSMSRVKTMWNLLVKLREPWIKYWQATSTQRLTTYWRQVRALTVTRWITHVTVVSRYIMGPEPSFNNVLQQHAISTY